MVPKSMCCHIQPQLIWVFLRDKAVANIKGAPFCGYTLAVPVCIGGITVRQSFFISRGKSSSKCILGQPFEAVTKMMRQTMNDGSVQMAIFSAQHQDFAVFQPFTPRAAADRCGYETVCQEPVEEEDSEVLSL